MSDHAVSAGNPGQDDPTPFDNLIGGDPAATSFGSGFTTTFRGYDKEEVDAAIAADEVVEGGRVVLARITGAHGVV